MNVLNKILYAVLLLSIAWLLNCTKELPPDVVEEPVFGIRATFDSSQYLFTAGDSPTPYLFTDWYLSGGGTVNCTGAFADSACWKAGCAPRLLFEFRNDKPDASVSPDDLFRMGRVFTFRGSKDIEYRVSASVGADSALYNNIRWIWQGSVYQGTSVSLATTSSLIQPLSVVAFHQNSGLLSSERNVVFDKTRPQAPFVRLGITPIQGTLNRRVEAIATPSGGTFTYNWSNGRTTNSFIDQTVGSSYSVTIQDTFGQTATAQIDSVGGFLPQPVKSPDIILNTSFATPTNTLQTGTVLIQWKDPLGRIWRSDTAPQPNGSSLWIISAEPYSDNEKGQKTYKVSVGFKGVLFNESGTQSIPMSGQGIIAVAYRA
jgi:hypothetical protein